MFMYLSLSVSLSSSHFLPPPSSLLPSLPPSLSLFSDPLAQFEVEKKEHEKKMRRMEEEMEDVFEVKVREKLQKLEDIKHDVSKQSVLLQIILFSSLRLNEEMSTTHFKFSIYFLKNTQKFTKLIA